MKINNELDQDGCLNVELIENSVEWHKEKGGDNILLQYINGGESMRIIERFPESVDIEEVHHHGKSLTLKFANGNAQGYYQDKMGNYKRLKDLNGKNLSQVRVVEENGQKKNTSYKSKNKENTINMAVYRNLGRMTY